MHPTLIAALAKPHVSVLDALPHLAGMVMVLATLTALWGVCALTAKLVHLAEPAAAPPAATAPAPPPVEERIAPEIVVVIAAAVTATVGRHHRIVSIRTQSSTWERAGRQSVLTSHRIR